MGFDVTSAPPTGGIQNDNTVQNTTAPKTAATPKTTTARGATPVVDGHAAPVTRAPAAVANPSLLAGLAAATGSKTIESLESRIEAKAKDVTKQVENAGQELVDAILAKFGGNIANMFK